MVAGLFGKLPAHGDFVRRGWCDATVDAVDRWLTQAIGAEEQTALVEWATAARSWRGYVPAGMLGPQALHLGVAASTDRVGRRFALALGHADDPQAAWDHAAGGGGPVMEALHDAVAGRTDADGAVAAVAAVAAVPAMDAPPTGSLWWAGARVVDGATVDAALLRSLLGRGRN